MLNLVAQVNAAGEVAGPVERGCYGVARREGSLIRVSVWHFSTGVFSPRRIGASIPGTDLTPEFLNRQGTRETIWDELGGGVG